MSFLISVVFMLNLKRKYPKSDIFMPHLCIKYHKRIRSFLREYQVFVTVYCNQCIVAEIFKTKQGNFSNPGGQSANILYDDGEA